MKIGIMLRHINELGGVVVYTRNIIENLLKIDSENDYILIYGNSSLIGTYSKYKNVKEVVINIKNKLLWDQIGVPRLVKTEKIDIIFNPKLSIPLFASCKKVFVLHGLEQFALPHIFKWYDQLYFHIMTPLYCFRATAIIVMTNKGKDELLKYIKTGGRKIEVIYESYHKRFKTHKNKEHMLQIKQKYSLPSDYIFFIGGITPLKNFSNIIKSFNMIKNKVSVKLVIAGFNRWRFAKDISLIKKLKLQNDVINLGFIHDDDLPYVYNSAQCLVFPSLYEGFGIPILEAQASECPVICSKTGCSSEVAGGAAVSVDPYNCGEIAQAIYDILNDKHLRSKLIKDGLENVKKFDWQKTAEKTLQLFNKLS